jgi:hypothetical protein
MNRQGAKDAKGGEEGEPQMTQKDERIGWKRRNREEDAGDEAADEEG